MPDTVLDMRGQVTRSTLMIATLAMVALVPLTTTLVVEQAQAHTGSGPGSLSLWGALEAETYDAPALLCDPNVELQHTEPLPDSFASGGEMARLPQHDCTLTWYGLHVPVNAFVTGANIRLGGLFVAGTVVHIEVFANGVFVSDQTVSAFAPSGFFTVINLDVHDILSPGPNDIEFRYSVVAGSPLTDLDVDCIQFSNNPDWSPDCQEVPCGPTMVDYVTCCNEWALDPSECNPCPPGADPRNCEPCDPAVNPDCCPPGTPDCGEEPPCDPATDPGCCPPEGCDPPCDPAVDPECCPAGPGECGECDPAVNETCCPPEGCSPPCDPATDPDCCPPGADPMNCSPPCDPASDPDCLQCPEGEGYNNADCCGEFGEYCDCDPHQPPGQGCPSSASAPASGPAQAPLPPRGILAAILDGFAAILGGITPTGQAAL